MRVEFADQRLKFQSRPHSFLCDFVEVTGFLSLFPRFVNLRLITALSWSECGGGEILESKDVEALSRKCKAVRARGLAAVAGTGWVVCSVLLSC